MKLDNIEQVKALLLDIENLFMELEDTQKQLEKQIAQKEGEQEDYLHELELGNLSGFEIMKVSKELIRTRKERRILKNKLELVKSLKGYADKYITKGIIGDTKQVINNIDNLKITQETRGYNPRVVKDLKCAKKRGDAKNEI